jgi:hypothetical protein
VTAPFRPAFPPFQCGTGTTLQTLNFNPSPGWLNYSANTAQPWGQMLVYSYYNPPSCTVPPGGQPLCDATMLNQFCKLSAGAGTTAIHATNVTQMVSVYYSYSGGKWTGSTVTLKQYHLYASITCGTSATCYNSCPCTTCATVGTYTAGCGGTSAGMCAPCSNAPSGTYYTSAGGTSNACAYNVSPRRAAAAPAPVAMARPMESLVAIKRTPL